MCVQQKYVFYYSVLGLDVGNGQFVERMRAKNSETFRVRGQRVSPPH